MRKQEGDTLLYLTLITLLVIPLFLLLIYASSDKEISVASAFTLEKASIKRPPPPKEEGKEEGEVNTSLAKDSTTLSITEENTIATDTTSQRILLLGDSMVEGLSKRLRQYAAQNNHELLNVIWYSSSSKLWAQTDTLAHFLNRFQPTYIMISLGGNELFVRDLDKREAYIQAIIQQLDSIPYIWIGPPNWKEDTGINDVILRNAGQLRYYPSKNLSFERTADGAHPTVESAASWMDSVAVWIEAESQYRIRMEAPDREGIDKGRTVLLRPVK